MVVVSSFDLRKAFDTVNPRQLIEHLKDLLSESELRITYILIEDVSIRVRVTTYVVSLF